MFFFKKGIDSDFVVALNKCNWWKEKIIHDRNLFIGIRNDYLNVYYKGNSLIKLEMKNDQLKGTTHYKYLLKNSQKKKYISSLDGIFDYDSRDFFVKSFAADFSSIVKTADVYSGDEKSGLHNILVKNLNIIDVEVAFTEEDDIKEKDHTPRIDFVALQTIKGCPEVVFFEAKNFSNKELRAKNSDKPKVVKQIGNYEKLICKHEDEIREAYISVLKNFIELDGYPLEKKNLFRQALRIPLKINPQPRLVIYGFDSDQKEGKNWRPHKEKLVANLGKDRVLLKGDSKDFRRGISL